MTQLQVPPIWFKLSHLSQSNKKLQQQTADIYNFVFDQLFYEKTFQYIYVCLRTKASFFHFTNWKWRFISKLSKEKLNAYKFCMCGQFTNLATFFHLIFFLNFSVVAFPFFFLIELNFQVGLTILLWTLFVLKGQQRLKY